MPLISRRQFIRSLGGLALAQALPGCGWLADQPVAIAADVWVGYEPLFFARREGWLDDKLVKLVETSSTTASLQALAEGKVDGAALTLDEVLKARTTGLPLAVVMVFDVSAGADMLIARPGMQKLADLKGRKIGFEEGTDGELMLTEVLQTAGLSKNDVKLISLTHDKQRAAWLAGQIDALVTYEPVAGQLLAQGAIKLFDSRQIPNTIVDVLAIRSDALDYRHATAIRHLLSAHFRALDHLHRNPHDAAYRMATHLGLPADEVLPSFKGLLLPDVTNNRLLLTGSPPPLLDTARKVSALMVQGNLLPHNDPLTALIRPDFLPTNNP